MPRGAFSKSSWGVQRHSPEVVEENMMSAEVTKQEVNQLLLTQIKKAIEATTNAGELECLSRALERVGLRP